MSDTRFTCEFWVNKQGELVGSMRLPKEGTVVLEALVDIVERYAAQHNTEFEQVLRDVNHCRAVIR